MTKTKLLFIGYFLFFLSCNSPTEKNTENTAIVAGTSKITGRIITPDGQSRDSLTATITVLHPISGENVRHYIQTGQLGQFTLDFDMETASSLLGLYTSVNPAAALIIKSKNNDSSHIEIAYNSSRVITNIEVTPAMNPYDMKH